MFPEKSSRITALVLCLLLGHTCLQAQDKPHAQDKSQAQEKSTIKFGKIAPADFDVSAPKFDSGASAVVIADIGYSTFVGNNKGWFSLEFKHFRRVKILNKNGFAAANVDIPLYSSGNAVESVNNLKAITYNLEGGKVIETKLDDKSVFTDKIRKNLVMKKFTFPAVKAGSIVEYSYTQQSDFLFNLQPWEFQGAYPCLWSEYNVTIPDFFKYVFLSQGYESYDIRTSASSREYYRLRIPGGAERDENYSFSDNTTDYRWVIKNVPPMKEESYTTTLQNHISKIEFQLSQYRFPDMPVKEKMGNWLTVSQELMKDDEFGAALSKNNGWLDDELKVITKGVTTPGYKARKIYAYVRENFTCTGHSALYAYTPLKTVFKNRNGTVAELNLLLAAMLAHENIPVDPVILGTRSHGYTHEMYPLMYRFNYVICRVAIDSSYYYLDASQPWLGFGRVPNYCYNGHARVITKDFALPVYFNPDMVTEGKTTLVILSNNQKGGLDIAYSSLCGYFESCDIRQKVLEKGEKEFFKKIGAAYPGGTDMNNMSIDSLKRQELPVKINYNLVLHPDSTGEMFYFNPILNDGYKENPFKAAERKYPVEMPAASDETYILNMEIPAGYTVEEVPRSAKVSLNDDEGFFEYLIVHDADNIQLRSRIKLGKANFTSDDYNTLRDFFGFIVKKQSEQIVFKRKKLSYEAQDQNHQLKNTFFWIFINGKPPGLPSSTCRG